jgi:hypothetical protein
MNKVVFVGLLAFAILAGAALAEQSGEQKQGSSMRGMMQEMMGDKGAGRGMGDMGNMMRMMGQMTKMMDQCTAMMESMETESGPANEGQKK